MDKPRYCARFLSFENMPKAKRDRVREVPFVLQTILPGACSQVEVRVEHDAITRPIGTRVSVFWLVKNREDLMDGTTSCPKCGKRLVPVVTISGRTDLQCITCDDPVVKWAESPLTAPEKPIVPERV